MTAEIVDHFAEHMLEVDPHDPIDCIELADRDGRRFRAAIISVWHHNGAIWKLHASGPIVTDGVVAGPSVGYISREWHSLDYVPQPVLDVVDAAGIVRSAVSS